MENDDCLIDDVPATTAADGACAHMPAGATASAKPYRKGGPRLGAGRRASDGATQMSSHTISIDDATRAFLMELGNNKLSVGVRKATRLLKERNMPPLAHPDLPTHEGKP